MFARIDAGFADDDRRRKLRTAVEAQLGISAFPPEAETGGDVKDIYKRGYGVEAYLNKYS